MSGEQDREALEDWLHDNRWPEPYDLSHAILASDWLAAREEEAEMRGYERGLLDPGSRWMRSRTETLRDLIDRCHRAEAELAALAERGNTRRPRLEGKRQGVALVRGYAEEAARIEADR